MRLNELIDGLTDRFGRPINADEILSKRPKPPRKKDGFLGKWVYNPLEFWEVISKRTGIDHQVLRLQSGAYVGFDRDFDDNLGRNFCAGINVGIPLYLPVNETGGDFFNVSNQDYELLKGVLLARSNENGLCPIPLRLPPYESVQYFDLFGFLSDGSSLEEVVGLLDKCISVAEKFGKVVERKVSNRAVEYMDRI
ncbi:MAG: hypothetical protein AABW89_03185 [Nanoarchaeota archaeon]